MIVLHANNGCTVLLFVVVFLGYNQYWSGEFVVLFQEHPKAQPAVVLVFKASQKTHSLKSYPTDWEKPGIEPSTPGLQNIGLSPYTTRLLNWCTVCWTPLMFVILNQRRIEQAK